MHFNVLALLACATTGALANDVYSTFEDSTGAMIGGDNYDVANTGCFSVTGAVKVSFSQSPDAKGTAYGPYCLTAWSDSGCTTYAMNQQFQNVVVNDNTPYQLNTAVAAAGHYTWSPNAC